MSTIRVLVIVPGEPPAEKFLRVGPDGSLAAMQAVVGGRIEFVPGKRPGTDLVVNEEGRLHRLPANPVLQRAGLDLVGPAFVTRTDREGTCVDLTDEDVRFYTHLFTGNSVH